MKGQGRSSKNRNLRSQDHFFHESYTGEELEFLKAIDKYKNDYQRPYLNYREVLYIAICLGYKKVIDKSAES